MNVDPRKKVLEHNITSGLFLLVSGIGGPSQGLSVSRSSLNSPEPVGVGIVLPRAGTGSSFD